MDYVVWFWLTRLNILKVDHFTKVQLRLCDFGHTMVIMIQTLIFFCIVILILNIFFQTGNFFTLISNRISDVWFWFRISDQKSFLLWSCPSQHCHTFFFGNKITTFCLLPQWCGLLSFYCTDMFYLLYVLSNNNNNNKQASTPRRRNVCLRRNN